MRPPCFCRPGRECLIVQIAQFFHNTSFRQMEIMEAVQSCMKSLPESYLLNYHEQLNVHHKLMCAHCLTCSFLERAASSMAHRDAHGHTHRFPFLSFCRGFICDERGRRTITSLCFCCVLDHNMIMIMIIMVGVDDGTDAGFVDSYWKYGAGWGVL